MAKSAIAKMREATWNGVINQNGANDHFYRVYDDKGRTVGSKEGITTVPADLRPRSVNVKTNLEGFKPELKDVNLEEGKTLQVNGQVWRNTPKKGELTDF